MYPKSKHYLVVVSVFLLCSCSIEIGGWAQNQVCPTQTLEGEDAIKAMRNNLEAVEKKFPDAKMRASIFYKNGALPVKDFFPLYQKYHFEVNSTKPELFGGKSSIGLVYPLNDDGVEGTYLTAEMLSPEGMQKYFLESSLHVIAPIDDEHIINEKNFNIDQLGTFGFSSFATSKDLLSLWIENPDTIGGIGIGCTLSIYYTKSISEAQVRGR